MDEAEYVPLLGLIEPHVDKKYDELPEKVKARVDEAFPPLTWDGTSPGQRKTRAVEVDFQHDPAMAAENQYWFDLFCEICEVEQEIARWRLMNDGGVPSEAQLKEEKISALTRNLKALESLWAAEPFTKDAVQPSKEQVTLQRAATVAQEVGVRRNKLRTNSLDVPIKKAIGLAGSLNLGAVWLELRALALGEEKPFTGVVESDGLCYTSDNNKPEKLSKDALRKRLKSHA